TDMPYALSGYAGAYSGAAAVYAGGTNNTYGVHAQNSAPGSTAAAVWGIATAATGNGVRASSNLTYWTGGGMGLLASGNTGTLTIAIAPTGFGIQSFGNNPPALTAAPANGGG